MPTPTPEEMLALVEQRVPEFSTEQKSFLARAAIAVLAEPSCKGKPPMYAVKVAIARLYRREP